MSLCPHGYTAFWDCPICECPFCERPQDSCICHLEPAAPQAPAVTGNAAPPLLLQQPAVAAASNDELLAQFADLMLKVNAARYES